MCKKHLFNLAIIFFCSTISFTAHAADIQLGRDITLPATSNINDNLIATGESHMIQGAINGDAIIAGNQLLFQGPIAGDLITAGSKVSLYKSSSVLKNAYIAASEAYIEGNLHQDLNLYTNRAQILATIAGNARLKGQDITINAQIEGSVKVTAPHILLGPNTHIHGDFKFASAQAPTIMPGARIDGKTIALPIETAEKPAQLMWTIIIFSTLSAWLFAMLLLHLFPHSVAAVSTNIGTHPGSSFVTGIISIITALILIPLLTISLIGLPLALIIAFLLITLSFFSAIPTAFYLVSVIAKVNFAETHNRLTVSFYLLLSLLALSLLSLLPVLGPIMQLILSITGIGAILLQKATLYKALTEKNLN